MLYFFCLIFVINGVPGGGFQPAMGVSWSIPRCPERILGVFSGYSGSVLGRGGSEPVPVFTDTPLFLKAFSFF